MNTETTTAQTALIDRTVEIACAYAGHNQLPAAALPDLVGIIHGALSRLGNAAPTAAPTEHATPAQVRASIKDEGIVSFLDGRSYKTLRRHITAHGLTPAEYRTRFGLPHDYPLVAPFYSKTRSALAKTSGLGRTAKPSGKPLPTKQKKAA